MNYRLLIIAFLLCAVVVINMQKDMLCVEDKFCYEIKIMRTDDEHKRGLMFVKSMPENKGMLFDFRKYEGIELAMWMKNTFIPLDMLFIGCDGVLKDIHKNATPLLEKVIRSKTKFCYVLEINAGEADKRKFSVNEVVDIDFSLMGYIKDNRFQRQNIK